MKTLLRKQLIFKATNFDDGSYTIKGVFSTPMVDRQGEVIVQSGWKLQEYMQNPVVLFAHDHYQPAIGKMVELGLDASNNLAGAIQFAAEEYDFAKTIYNLYKGGYMRAFSVGFENNTYEVDQTNDTIILKENTLYEVSAVNIPANAMALAEQKGLDMKPLMRVIREQKMMQKGVVPFVASPMRPEGTSWDANAVQAEAWQDGENQARYAKIHAWFDDNQNDDDGDGYPDIKSAYKLPHHDINLKVVWDGVAAAMAALLGARGGVAIPDSDRQGVYTHLSKHYAQFDKSVPEMKKYTEIELKEIEETGNLKAIEKPEDQAKAVEVISRSNKETIQSAIKTLTEVLGAVGTDKKVDKVETPEKGGKKISVKLLNKAMRELLEIKKNIK
jgi:HK97 family phage prohead protease